MLLTALLAVAAVAAAARWYGALRAAADGRRPRPGFPVVAALCAELTVIAAVPVVRWAAEERRLSDVASVLAGTQARVHCQRLSSSMIDATSDLGHVRLVDGRPEHATLLKNEQCHYLEAYAAGAHRHPTQDEVIAVHVLTHESMHMRGLTSESDAECAAVQRDALTAERLGATPAEASALAVDYWRTVYPHMPDAYRTPNCGPGRPLDEHLPTAPWAAGG